MTEKTKQFQSASVMSYADLGNAKLKTDKLIEDLKNYLISKEKKESCFDEGQVVYIPDLHGDFVHFITVLYYHGLLNEELNLLNNYSYVFLGDFYDRAPDSICIDNWLNRQIRSGVEIYRLLGNHEYSFIERGKDGYPKVFPSQDSINDASRGFKITENILENIASGNLIAAYVSENMPWEIPTLFVHSYVNCDDFNELGISESSNIYLFATLLNERLKENGKKALEVYLDQKNLGMFNWSEVSKVFEEDKLFNMSSKVNDINTSFLWRRTGLKKLSVYPVSIDEKIPDDVYQIVGHTPVFSFRLSENNLKDKPFVISSKKSSGKIQFSDVGIGYYYKDDTFDRPDVSINPKEATEV